MPLGSNGGPSAIELPRPLARAFCERSDDDEVARRVSHGRRYRPAEPLGELAQRPGLVGVAEEQRLRARALEDERRPAVQAFGAHPADPNCRQRVVGELADAAPPVPCTPVQAEAVGEQLEASRHPASVAEVPDDRVTMSRAEGARRHGIIVA